MAAPTGRRSKRAAKPKPAPEAEPEAAEEEALTDDEETPDKPKRDTTPLPSGEELYNAKYVDGMTWQEIRDNLDPRIRSPRGLAIIAAYVIENGLEDEHPEFTSIAELEGDELAQAIVEAHDAGQGWAVLAARADLKIGEVQDIYVDAGGENPGRVGGQRYGGGRSVGKETPTEEEASDDQADSVEEEELTETVKPSAKRRAKNKPAPKAKPAPAANESPAAKPAARRRRGTPTPS
jgi:hypothetical protein